MGGFLNGGQNICFPKFCFGPKSVPKGPLGWEWVQLAQKIPRSPNPRLNIFQRRADGGFSKWGGKITFFSKFCFGPITVPKGPFGVGMGPIGQTNHKESDSGLKNSKN